MRAYQQDSEVRVAASFNDVGNFMSEFPGNNLNERPLSFTFERKSGDLIDTTLRPDEDGQAANALCEHCKQYAIERGLIADVEAARLLASQPNPFPDRKVDIFYDR